MTSKGLHKILWPLLLLLSHLIPTFPSITGIQLYWLPYCFKNLSSILLPPDLCHCCSLCLECSSSCCSWLLSSSPSSLCQCHFLREVLLDYYLQFSALSPDNTLSFFLNSTPMLRNSYLFMFLAFPTKMLWWLADRFSWEPQLPLPPCSKASCTWLPAPAHSCHPLLYRMTLDFVILTRLTGREF